MRAELQNYLENVLGIGRLSTDVLVAKPVEVSTSTAQTVGMTSSVPRVWLWDCAGQLQGPGELRLRLQEMAEKLQQAITPLFSPSVPLPRVEWEDPSSTVVRGADLILGFGATAEASARWGDRLLLLPALAELHQSPALKKQAWSAIRAACAQVTRS